MVKCAGRRTKYFVYEIAVEVKPFSGQSNFYITSFDGVQLRLQVALPEGERPFPGVMMAHGSSPEGVRGYILADTLNPHRNAVESRIAGQLVNPFMVG